MVVSQNVKPETNGSVPLDSFLNVVRALAGAELDDPKVGKPVREERIFLGDSESLGLGCRG
jgi:hypothetical protein